MNRYKLDNGILLIAFLSNALVPFGILVWFAVQCFTNPDFEEGYIFLAPLALFVIISSLMISRFKRIEFDEGYVFVKNLFGKETDAFPFRDLRCVKPTRFSFGSGKSKSMKQGKSYWIAYVDSGGIEQKVRFMATVNSETIEKFKALTAFL